MLPKQDQKYQQQEEQEDYLSHTDSMGHVFLSIGEDDLDLMEMLQVRDSNDYYTHPSLFLINFRMMILLTPSVTGSCTMNYK